MCHSEIHGLFTEIFGDAHLAAGQLLSLLSVSWTFSLLLPCRSLKYSWFSTPSALGLSCGLNFNIS